MSETTSGVTRDLIDALAWLREMAGCAIDHLDPEWARKGGPGNSNILDLQSALTKADAALEAAREEGERG